MCDPSPINEKFAAFGWNVETVNGHDLAQLEAELGCPNNTAQPKAIIANTIKGKGVSFMEDIVHWHHGVPSNEEYQRGLKEIDAAIDQLEGALL